MRRNPEPDLTSPGVDGRRSDVDPARVVDPGDSSGYYKPPGGVGPAPAATTGARDGDMSRAEGTLRAVLRRVNPTGDDQLHGAGVTFGARS